MLRPVQFDFQALISMTCVQQTAGYEPIVTDGTASRRSPNGNTCSPSYSTIPLWKRGPSISRRRLRPRKSLSRTELSALTSMPACAYGVARRLSTS